MRSSSALLIGGLFLGAAGAAFAKGEAQQGTPPPQSPAPGAAAPTMVPRFEITGLSAPESVLYDAAADVYLISNINGSPFAHDHNGFIARVAPSGEILTLKWIDGSQRASLLDAPKGMAILGDRLFVADIDTVRVFDRATAAPREAVKIPGAVFLNDVAAGGGSVYVSDTGIKEDFSPTGTAAVYELRDGKVKALARGPELKGPNGLALRGQELWTATMSGDELYRLTADGHRADVTRLPQGQLDGLLILADGTFLVSSHQASDVYVGRPGSDFTIAVSGVATPADIGFDGKRSRLLVPLLGKDTVAAFDWAPARTRYGRSAPERPRRP
jgi:sugar lactone lactonase YvrE